LFSMSVLPYRAAAPLLVIMRDALFAPLCLYPPPNWLLGFLSYAPLVRLLHVSPVVRLRVGPGVGVRVLLCGKLLLYLLVGGELPRF
jgi:hypothetical protein